MNKDSLGDRMKGYENITRNKLMRRGYTIIRIDGKAFHTYTRGLERPFDEGLISDMTETAKYLCENIMGAKIGYVQSDEISLVLTDFETHETQAWFDGNIQKIASISASIATSKFNQLRLSRRCSELGPLTPEVIDMFNLAQFDARVFQVPTRTEAINYLIWRQQDAVRNSISSVAQSLYSHKELHGVNVKEMQELIFQKGINWNDYSVRKKRGGMIRKITEVVSMDVKSFDMMPAWHIPEGNVSVSVNGTGNTRTKWIEDIKAPEITKDREYYENIIPNNQ